MSDTMVFGRVGQPVGPPGSGGDGESTAPPRHGRRADALARLFRGSWDWFGRQLAYLVGGWPHLALGVTVVGLVLTAGVVTSPVVVGLFLVAGGLGASRWFADVERWFLRTVFGYEARPRSRRQLDLSSLRGLLTTLTDADRWREALWIVVAAVVGTVSVAWTAWGLNDLCLLVLMPVRLVDEWWRYVHAYDPPSGQSRTETLRTVLQIAPAYGLRYLLWTVSLLASMPLMTWLRVRLALGLLCLDGSRLTAPLAEPHPWTALRRSRDAGRVAEAGTLRKLERDIHDGPQQRLVRLGLDLARAERVAVDDPQRAQEMIGEAIGSTHATLGELRQLSRGIAPPVLVDRGLEAALVELAGQSDIPATALVDIPVELPPHVAQAAYFVASEAIANANKHSNAKHLTIDCAIEEPWLFVTVTDDGIGGASASKGHGLAGLTHRLEAVDGTLTLTSPAGGPTTVEAAMPWRA